MDLDTYYNVLVVAPIATMALFFVEILKGYFNRWFAYRRLKKDPYVYVGARLHKVQCTGSDAPLVDAECMVTRLSLGRMEVTVFDESSPLNGAVYTFRGQEFEGLHPVFKAGGNPRLN